MTKNTRKTAYAQHFLRSPSIAAMLIGHSTIKKRDLVYDLGAGSGVISAALSRRSRYVVAVEHEPVAYSKLVRNMAEANNVKVVRADMFEVQFPLESYKIFANIPFSQSSQLVRHLCFQHKPPAAIYLIVQKQFAKKLFIDTDHFTSALGAMIAPWWRVRIRKPLKRHDFTPPPGVETVLLELLPRETPLLPRQQSASYCDFVEAMFHDHAAFQRVAPGSRPSRLRLAEWCGLYQMHGR